MKPIITDSNSFQKYIDRDAVYVDKTAQLHRLITSPESDNFFISRPRRFGKSLMISTLEAIFKGQRDLFRGLAIDSLDYDWEEYPVLHFDFSNAAVITVERFENSFTEKVRSALHNAGVAYDKDIYPEDNFANAIEFLAEKTHKPVVILIDEYDAPVGRSLDDFEKAEKIRDILSSFYITIKAKNHLIRFMMMTGVSKFTQLSVFSALNHLTDLTLRRETADLLGYTSDDLETYFDEHMRAHAEVMGVSYETYRTQLQRWSDGYRFSPYSTTQVYNPYSIANTLSMMLPNFISTWSSTARPSFLTRYSAPNSFLGRDYEHIKGVTESIFDASNLRALKPVTLLYQAGYLTIKDVEDDFYSLGIPNQEVRQDLNQFLLDIHASGDRKEELDSIRYALSHHNFAEFETILKAFYAGLPYGSREEEIRQSEFSYARIFNALLQGAGFELRPEDTQTCGRPDLVAKGPRGTYIFEFKVDASAQAALDQIHAKDYAAPFRNRGLPIFAFGINFDSKTARINDFLMETLA